MAEPSTPAPPPLEGAVLYLTWPDEAGAREAARALLEARLAACVHVWPLGALYRWRGAVEEAREAALLVKTTAAAAADAIALLRARHPYDTPAILGWRAEAALSLPQTLAWLAAEADGADPMTAPARTTP